MTSPLSRFMSAATASYGVFALASPRHLGRALVSGRRDQADFDLLARTYGARDLVVSSIGLFSKSDRMVTAAMLVRIGCDVTDGLLLAPKAENDAARAKVLAVTMSWAALNTLALVVDRRGD